MVSFPNLCKHPHILLFLCIGRALHMLDADGSVYVCGKAAFNPFHFMLKYLDLDNKSFTTTQAHWMQNSPECQYEFHSMNALITYDPC